MPSGAKATPKSIIRTATLADAAALARLSDQLGYPASATQVAHRLQPILVSRDHVVFVAELPDAASRTIIAGWVHACLALTIENDPTVEIKGLVVEEAWRGAGIGRLLMESAEHWAQASAARTVSVRCSVIREEAHDFYQRLGYQLIKSQRVFRKPL